MWRPDALPLRPYQAEGVEWMSKRGSYLLADEMGLGKTAMILKDFSLMREKIPKARLLVVSPNLNLYTPWQDEIEKWTTFSAEVATGSPTKRAKAIDAKADVTVIAYDNIDRELARLNSTGFEYVIFDEAHKIKNPKSKRTKAAFNLRSMKRGLSTGTPILNRVDELWPLLFIIDPVRFHNYWTFLNKYAVFGGYENKQVIGVQNAAELRAIVNPLMLRRLKADVMKALPPKTYVKRECDLLPVQRKMYDKAKDELILELESESTDITNPLTKLTRLKQIIGTPACFDLPDVSGKLDLAMEVLSEIGEDEKVVFFTQHLGVARALNRRLATACVPHLMHTGDQVGTERADAVRTFQGSTKVRALVCTYGVSTEGITLNAATHAIMVDKLYVPAMQTQAEDRLHRNREDNVTIIELFARKTVEQKIEKMLAGKRKVFDAVITEDTFEAGLRPDELKDLLRD